MKGPQDMQTAHSIHQAKGQQQPRKKLAGNAAVYVVISTAKFPGTKDGVRRRPGELAAHSLHFLPQRAQWTLGESAGHVEGCLDAQSPYHRQKEAQCRAAVLAGEGGGFWESRNRADPVSGVHLLNVRT